MEPNSSSTFLDYWHFAMIIGAIAMASLALIIYVIHNLRNAEISSRSGSTSVSSV